MWLLDANMPLQLVALLRDLGIEADSAVARGWNTLSNGRLVEAAVHANFAALLTRQDVRNVRAKRAQEICGVLRCARDTSSDASATIPFILSVGVAERANQTGAWADDRLACGVIND